MITAGLVLAMLLGGGPSSPEPRPSPGPTFDDCERLRREQPQAPSGYACYYAVGHRTGDLEGTRRRLEAIVEAEPEQAYARSVLANVLVDLGDRERGTALAREALDALERHPGVGPRELTTAELNLAGMLRDHGRHDEALTCFEGAEARAARAGDPVLHAMTQLELAHARWLRGGELARLREQVDAALPVVLASKRYMYASKALVIAANLAHASGDVPAAIAHRERIVELATEHGDAYAAAGVLGTLTWLYAEEVDLRLEHADYEGVRARVEAALRTAERAGNVQAAGSVRCTLGYLERDAAAAIDHLRACLAVEQQVGAAAGAHNARSALADRLAGVGPAHHAEARALAVANLEQARAEGALAAVLLASSGLARVLWRVGDHEGAIAQGLRSLEHLELLRDLQLDERDRTHSLHHYAAAYYLLSGRLLGRPGRTDEELELAFATMERLRARTLLERLVMAEAASVATDDPRASDRDAVLRSIAAVQRRLVATGLSSHERTALLAEVGGLEEREHRLRTELARHDERFAELRMPQPPSLLGVAASLPRDQAILAFQVADELDDDLLEEGGSWLLVVTRDGVASHRLPDRFRLEQQVPMLASLVARRDGSEIPGLVRLHRDLLADALAELSPSIERLVVVPDGVLYDVPFAALRAAPDEPPLAERFELTLSPSVGSLVRWQRAPGRREGALLALASGSFGLGGSGLRAGVLDHGLALGPLPRRARGAADRRRLRCRRGEAR